MEGGRAIAFMNAGGLGVDLLKTADGTVTYAELFACQPFNNSLVTLTLTGVQIKTLLEQQWLVPAPLILHGSNGFAYTWDAARPAGGRGAAGQMWLNGQPLEPRGHYRVEGNPLPSHRGSGFH